MPITKKNKKMLGGAAMLVDRDKLNNDFAQIFLSYLTIHKEQPDKNILGTSKYIYIGLCDINDILIFGTTDIDNKPTTTTNKTSSTNQLTIDDKPNNRILINKFKLYIMSIMANYKINDTSLYKKLEPFISPDIKMPEIMKILSVEPLPVCKPAPALPPPPPVAKVNDDDMLELNIYREFGVKCTTQFSTSSCVKYDNDYKSYWNNKSNPYKIEFDKNITEVNKSTFTNARPQLFKREEQFRNLYVNMFEYITGTEGNNSGFEYIIISLRYLKFISNDIFYGFKSELKINIDKLVSIVNKLRDKVIERQLIKNNPFRLKL